MDIFEELGLHRYINAQDTFTTYGASCMPAASLRAMREIASSCVELAEVQAKTGDALAKLTHNEGAYISNGAAGGMMVATAAALARDDEKIFHSLPEITGPRYEVVMQAAQRKCMTAAARLSAQKCAISVQRTPLRLWKSWKQPLPRQRLPCFMSSFLGAMPLYRWKQWWRWPTAMGCP